MSVKQAASVLAKASWQRNGKRKAMVLQKKKNETNADKRRKQADRDLVLRREGIARKNQRVLPGRIPKMKKPAPKSIHVLLCDGALSVARARARARSR